MGDELVRTSRAVEVMAVGAAIPGWAGAIRERVDAELSRFIDGADLPGNLREAVRYATVQGGKRLRPVLAWLCAEAVGGDGEASLPAGCAVECVHAFSLVHDDLPALDDDDLRRGRPTLHKHAGEAMAVLAGDALLTMAYWAIDGAGGAEGAGRRDALRRELTVGTLGMIGGQVYDTLGGMPAELDARAQLELIHRGKTAALLRAACRMGAICALPEGDADEERLEAVSAYGEAIGLLFQVVDDLIDVEQSAEVAGKRTGKDAEAGKTTYPGVLGLDESRRAADVLLESAQAAARRLGKGEQLEELAVYMRWRTR